MAPTFLFLDKEALVYEDSDYAIETAVKAGFKVIKVIDELNIVEVETEI